jgi:putative molybdopterin biosynthesis protein
MNTHEVAEYLRIKERKVYDLVRRKQIPCTRASGKWLFPKYLIDRWLTGDLESLGSNDRVRSSPPPVVAGSHDPLLDWALLESNCGLALMGGGSLSGLKKFASGEVMACAMHVLDSKTGQYNVQALYDAYDSRPPGDLVLVEWASRRQGLILASGNPKNISGFADLVKKKARIVVRQMDAGSRVLFENLINAAGFKAWEFNINDAPAKNETELGLAIKGCKADAGLGLAAVALQYGLDFIPLCQERFDILIRRRDYFESPFQKLIALTHLDGFSVHAHEMGGYDISGRGTVHFNG